MNIEQTETLQVDASAKVEVLTRSWPADQAEFMLLGKQTVSGLNLSQLGRYLKHLQEELKEVAEASENGETVPLVDGLLDAVVIALGALLSVGVDPEFIWSAVYAANMRKFPDGKPYYRPDGQIGKPPSWYGPEGDILIHLKEKGIPEKLPPLI